MHQFHSQRSYKATCGVYAENESYAFTVTTCSLWVVEGVQVIVNGYAQDHGVMD